MQFMIQFMKCAKMKHVMVKVLKVYTIVILRNKKDLNSVLEGVSKFRYILFSYPSVKNAYNETKPRLSQAKALPYHKNFVSL